MLSIITEMLSYDFIRRAFVAGLALAIASALIGVPLVLKNKSMLSDGLSHASFGAVAFALVLGIAPTWFALIISIIASLLIFKLENKKAKNSDAAIAVLSSGALAIGMIALTLNKGIAIDPNSYLFGSILAITKTDLILSILVGAMASLLYVIFFKQIFAVSFDSEFAAATGIKVKTYETILAVACSVVVVLGMKICGALLISAFVVMPVLGAIKLAKNFKQTILISVFLSIISFVLGFIASYILSVPAGASIVVAELAVLTMTSIIAKI
jgi:zinc transport system permease protein